MWTCLLLFPQKNLSNMTSIFIIGILLSFSCTSTFALSVAVPGTLQPAFVCPENAVVDTCVNPCQPTCGNLYIQPCPTFTCSTGCRCKPGYVWSSESSNSQRKCILPQQCNTQAACGLNEQYTTCGSACPETCDQSDFVACTMQCVEGCSCANGFVRDTASGKCIEPGLCPLATICQINEVYQSSGTQCTCEQCKAESTPGCYCRKGFVRNRFNRCVSSDFCPSCGGDPNAKINPCANCPYQRSCGNLFSPYVGCGSPCEAGCSCKGLLVRARNGKCVSPISCLPELLFSGSVSGGVGFGRK